MNPFKYFDLDILQAEADLGPSSKDQAARKKARLQKSLWLTLLMYLVVFLGVVSENLLRWAQTKPLSGASFFEIGQFVSALIIATAIFPHVFPKLFGKMKGPRFGYEDLAPHLRFLQFSVAFQNGFFWQSLARFF